MPPIKNDVLLLNRFRKRSSEVQHAMNAHSIFHLLRSYEKKFFPWMESIEDRDLIATICAHEDENPDGITCKQLYLANIAPAATVQRRVRRLIELGALRKRQSARDARVFFICLSDEVKLAIECYVAILKRSGLIPNQDAQGGLAPLIFHGSSGTYKPILD